MEEYQCYIVRTAYGLGYIQLQIPIENELCHTILTKHCKKSKPATLICAQLLGRAYSNVKVLRHPLGRKDQMKFGPL